MRDYRGLQGQTVGVAAGGRRFQLLSGQVISEAPKLPADSAETVQ
jgi:hypothetical protein